MKRILCLLLALLFLPAMPAAYGEEIAPPPAVEQACQSLVRLYGMGTDSETGQRSRWMGTGFAVGIAGADSDIFLTNWHVATGSGIYADDQVELWLLKDDARFDSDLRPLPECAVKCRVLITTDGYPDVAVIQALEPVQGFKALPLLPSAQAEEGTAVFSLGFPGLKYIGWSEASGPEAAQITSGTIQDHLVMTQAGSSQAIIHSAGITHGFSGGPLVDQRGVVVAQNTYGFQQEVSTQFFCAVYIDYGMELLDRLNLPYTLADSPSRITVLAANLLSPAMAAVLFGLGAVLILGGACYVTKRRVSARRGKSKCSQQERQ